MPPEFQTSPPAPIRAQYSPGEIPGLSAQAEQTATTALNVLAAIPAPDRTVDNTLLAFDRIMTDFSDTTQQLILMGYVYPDPIVAAEGMAVEASSQIFINGVNTRRDLYDVIKGQEPRTPGEARLYEVTIRKFEHNGLHLPDDRLATVRAMRANLSGLESQFSSNLNNDNTLLEFTDEELIGVPPSSMAAFTRTAQGTCLVTTKYPDYLAVMMNADISGSRKRMYAAYNNRQAGVNTALLEQAIELRRQVAKDLGYSTWADFQLDGRMAKNTGAVMAFLTSLKEPLKEKTQAELAELLIIKKERDPDATAIDPWDVAWLLERQKKEQYAYNDEEVREYFPVDLVQKGLFGICGTLFDIGFDDVEDVPVWSPEVRLFRVSNLIDNATVGYLYLDLYPREGKYGHFCASPVTNGRQKNGMYNPPVLAIIGNFHAPDRDKPALLTMEEIETLFHETGHAMHVLLTTVPYGTQSGFNVEWDFVETPSQTLEEWAWDPQVLESISGHYTDTSRKIPVELRNRVIASRKVGNGYYYSRQLANAMVDMQFHTATGPVSVTDADYRTYEEIMGIRPLAGTHPMASFGHLMGGYDAGYYGYLWSKVYALNIVDAFKQSGMTSRDLGMKFRQEILARGNMEDGSVLLKKFLGKEPGVEALYERLGIKIPQVSAGTR